MSTIQVGIDLGTTNTLVYGKMGGKIKPIKVGGNVTIPSVLYVEENGVEVIGRHAKQKEYLDPRHGIHSSKTHMGTKQIWTIRGKKYTPTDVAAKILSTVYDAVKAKYSLTDEDKIQAIITIPAYFSSNQSDETKKAGERAGFEVLRIITEPVAAAYNINPQENGLICVIDLGGGTFDVSVVDKQKDRYIVLGIDGDPCLGGDDFDKKLEEYFLKDIEDDLDIDLSTFQKSGLGELAYNSMKAKIRKDAIRCKEELSDDEEYNVLINDLFTYGNNKVYHYDTVVTRDQFNELCHDLYDRILSVVKRLIENNPKFKKQDIKNVYLVGGSCYIPMIRQIIEDYFGIVANTENGLEEQVAQGAAKIADGYNTPVYSKDGCIIDPFADYIQDITSHSMGIKILNGKYSEIIPVGTPYPCSICDDFTTSCDNQEEVFIEVYEKKNKSAHNSIDGHEEDYELYGSFILSGIEKAPRGQPNINVTFEYDLSRTLKVTAKDEHTGAMKTVTLKKNETVIRAKSAKPTDFFIALDVSYSMDGNRIKQAMAAYVKLVQEMLDLNTHQLGLITFGSNAKCLCELTHYKDKLLSAVSRIKTSGSTSMTEAIEMAADKLNGSKNNRALLIITDGEPNNRRSTEKSAEIARHAGITIAAIGVEDADTKYLEKIASKKEINFMVNDISKLSDTFGQAVQNLLSK